MDSIIANALEDLRSHLTASIQQHLNDQFAEIERREKLLFNQTKELESREAALNERAKELGAQEKASSNTAKAAAQPQSDIQSQNAFVGSSAPKPSALFPKSTAAKSSPLFPPTTGGSVIPRSLTPRRNEQANAVSGASSPRFQPPRSPRFQQNAESSEPAQQRSLSPRFAAPRSPRFEQPSDAAAAASQGKGALFSTPEREEPALLFQPRTTTSRAAGSTVSEETQQQASMDRESCGSASQLKSMFEQRAKAEDSAQPRKSWSSRNCEVALPNSADTGSFRAHDAPYKSKTAFTKPVREKRDLADLLEKGP